MTELSLDLYKALMDGHRTAILLFALTNASGVRIYGEADPAEEYRLIVEPPRADGTYLADGSVTAGADSVDVVGHGGLLVNPGRLRETMTPISTAVLGAYEQTEAGSMTVQLNNAGPPEGRPFTLMEAAENVLGAEGRVILTFPGVLARDALTTFSGTVVKSKITATMCELTMEAA